MHTDNSPEQTISQTAKVAPEAVTLRAQPRPVTRLNRRTLAALVGGVSVAVLGATIWSLQPQRHGNHEQTELYKLDHVAKAQGSDVLPTDYSKLPPALPPDVPEFGAAVAGRLGASHHQFTATRHRALSHPGLRPRRCLAQRSQSRSGIIRFLPRQQSGAIWHCANAGNTRRWRPERIKHAGRF